MVLLRSPERIIAVRRNSVRPAGVRSCAKISNCPFFGPLFSSSPRSRTVPEPRGTSIGSARLAPPPRVVNSHRAKCGFSSQHQAELSRSDNLENRRLFGRDHRGQLVTQPLGANRILPFSRNTHDHAGSLRAAFDLLPVFENCPADDTKFEWPNLGARFGRESDRPS